MLIKPLSYPADLTALNLQRRRLLALPVCAGLAATGRAHAVADLVLLILPALVPALVGLWGVKHQILAEQERMAAERKHAEAQLRLERERLAFDRRVASRSERIALLQMLAGSDEELRRSIFERMDMSQLVDRVSREAISGVLTEDSDGHGTRLGVVQGHIAVERGEAAGWVDNGTAQVFAQGLDASTLERVPVPVSALRRELNRRTTADHQAAFARALELAENDVARSWTLVGERSYSQARSPRGQGDVLMVTFRPATGRGGARHLLREHG